MLELPILIRGDCRETMAAYALTGQQFDAIICDPPYELTSITQRFGKLWSARAQFGKDGSFQRLSGGFMNVLWDSTGVAMDPETWRLAYEILKPGGHLIAMGGTRTYHRLVCAIEDAGFEIRDSLAWLYGTGWPKSHDVSKGIDKRAGAKREVVPTVAAPTSWFGWGTALKPAMELIVMVRKPLAEDTVAANVLKYGTGGINVDACRVPVSEGEEPVDRQNELTQDARYTEKGSTNFAAKPGARRGRPYRISHADPGNGIYGAGIHGSHAAGDTTQGRWPANVLHDGAPETVAAFPLSKGQQAAARTDGTPQNNSVYGALHHGGLPRLPRGDEGSAARFFYSAKAGKRDRVYQCTLCTISIDHEDRSAHQHGRLTAAGGPDYRHIVSHPTCKPLALMRWLCQLVTPPGGRVLDPFAGSGTTLQAAYECGFDAVGCEAEPQYQMDIEHRIMNCFLGRINDVVADRSENDDDGLRADD